MRFLYFGSLFFFSRSGSQKLKKRVRVFLNSISFKSYKTFQTCKKTMRSERTEMALKERIFRVIEFPETFLLIIHFLASGQILLKSAKSLLSCNS